MDDIDRRSAVLLRHCDGRAGVQPGLLQVEVLQDELLRSGPDLLCSRSELRCSRSGDLLRSRSGVLRSQVVLRIEVLQAEVLQAQVLQSEVLQAEVLQVQLLRSGSDLLCSGPDLRCSGSRELRCSGRCLLPLIVADRVS